MKHKRHTAAAVSALVVLLPVLAAIGSITRQLRQQDLDHALIVALKRRESSRALALLARGASANACDRPYRPVTARSLFGNLVGRIRGLGRHESQARYPPALSLIYDGVSIGQGPADSSYSVPLLTGLLDRGADMNGRDENGFQIADNVIFVNDAPALRLLIAHHLDVNARDKRGRPLLCAATTVSKPCMDVLIRSGARVNALDPDGHQTALFDAARFGSIADVQALLNAGADVNVLDMFGQTPLFGAVEHADPAIVDLLLRYGARVNYRDGSGGSPLQSAEVYAHFGDSKGPPPDPAWPQNIHSPEFQKRLRNARRIVALVKGAARKERAGPAYLRHPSLSQ